jgi:hypothetical protein
MTLSECCKAELIETGFTYEKMQRITTKTQCKKCRKSYHVKREQPESLKVIYRGEGFTKSTTFKDE